MGRATIILTNRAIRERAKSWIDKAPMNTRVEFKASRRSLPQNDRMWAMLTDVATQVPWHGVKLGPEDWKLIFLDALNRELRIVPNIDGTGFVNLGRSSSDLSKAEMSDLMELIAAWGTQNGVVLSDSTTLGTEGEARSTGMHTNTSSKEYALEAGPQPLAIDLCWARGEQRIPPWMIDRYGYEKATRIGVVAMVGGKDKTRIRNATTGPYRDLLISIAETAHERRRTAA